MGIENLSSIPVIQRNNHEILPRSIRGIIVGKSGSGKTNLLMNLLLKDGYLDYDNLMVYGKSLFQEEYKLLKKLEDFSKDQVLKLFRAQNTYDIEEVIKKVKSFNLKIKPDIKVTFFDNDEDILDPAEISKQNKNLIIFDDIIGEKQRVCEDYYTRGRHSNIDCFYISQNFFKLPRQTIRENANLIMVFRQDNKSLNHIYQDYVSDDFTFKEFKKMFNKILEDPHGFLTKEQTKTKRDGKYKDKLTPLYFL